MTFLTISEVNLSEKRVCIRVDFNVPMFEGKINDNARIKAALPTIRLALEQRARILLWSHLGRPKEGVWDNTFSLAPIAEELSTLLSIPVRFEKNWLEGVMIAPGEIVLGENVRFNVGEHDNQEALSRKMASLCDVFVMDAFATAHRSEASTVGVARYAPVAVGGILLAKEMEALSKVIENPDKPLVAIVGGSKVSDKFQLLKRLLEKVDVLIVGGGIANTFLASEGVAIGSSLYEPEKLALAQELDAIAKQRSVLLITPRDVVVSTIFSNEAKTRISDLSDIASDEKIGDVGPLTIAACQRYIKHAKTIVWNGPLGIFELSPFSEGTRQLGQAISEGTAYSIGGGDTGSAITQFGLTHGISYLSTGGGSFLTYLEGESLPAVKVLEDRAKKGMNR